ncbi:MAG: 2'-5' RNA ligase family protein [Dehalococcoidia bacterium]
MAHRITVIELLLDQTSDATVRQIWRSLAGTGVTTPVVYDSRPHITLAACGRLAADDFRDVLSAFAAAAPAFPLAFASIGIFLAEETAVLFLAPVVTRELLALHERFFHRVGGFADDWEQYSQPGNWVPHCTLAMRLASSELGGATEICSRLRLPLHGRIEQIGVADVFPDRIASRHTYALTRAIDEPR